MLMMKFIKILLIFSLINNFILVLVSVYEYVCIRKNSLYKTCPDCIQSKLMNNKNQKLDQHL